jgi:hypothetical protein
MLLRRVTEATHTADGLTSATSDRQQLSTRHTHLTQFINWYSLNDLGVHDKTPRGAIIMIIIVIVVVAAGTGVGG